MSKQVAKRKREEPVKSAPKIRRSSLDSPIADTEWRAASEDMFAKPLDSRALQAGTSIRSPIATRRRTTMFVSTSTSVSRSVPASSFYGDVQSERAATAVVQRLPKTGPLKDQASKAKVNPASRGGGSSELPSQSAGQLGRQSQGAVRSKLTRLRRPSAESPGAGTAKAGKPVARPPHASSSLTGLARVKAGPEQQLAEATPATAAAVAAAPPTLSAAVAAAAASGRPSRHGLHHDVSLAAATSTVSAADVSMQSVAFMTPTAVAVLRDSSATNVRVSSPAEDAAADDSKPVRALLPANGQPAVAEPELPAAAFYTPAVFDSGRGRRKRQLVASQSQSAADAATPANKRVRGRPRKAPQAGSLNPTTDTVAETTSSEDDQVMPPGEMTGCQQVAAAKVVGDAVPKEEPSGAAQACEPSSAAEGSSDCLDARSYRALAAYEAGDTYSTSKWCSVM